jgi:hypothetical protein
MAGIFWVLWACHLGNFSVQMYMGGIRLDSLEFLRSGLWFAGRDRIQNSSPTTPPYCECKCDAFATDARSKGVTMR